MYEILSEYKLHKMLNKCPFILIISAATFVTSLENLGFCEFRMFLKIFFYYFAVVDVVYIVKVFKTFCIYIYENNFILSIKFECF